MYLNSKIFFLLLLIYNLNHIISEGSFISKFNAVYRIDSNKIYCSLIIINDKVLFNVNKDRKEENFRIIPSDKNNLYYIESKPFNKRIGVNNQGGLVLLDKTNNENTKSILWKIIEINNNEYLIQNNLTNNYIELKENVTINSKIYYPICNKNLDKIKSSNISQDFKFSFFKLCEEVQIKPEHIKIINEEPIDIVIKYIDLSDKNLDRKGIYQIKKDEDNGELRYSVRSIFENLSWIRKIFIIMPNERVRFFKSVDEIKDKFVYIKDKDLLGFDSENSNVFQYNLYNLSKFGLSENFILIDDDYFFGKPIKKSQFFYYDEELKKVLPSIVNDDFSELIRKKLARDYNIFFRKKYFINCHSHNGWLMSQINAFKLLADNFDQPLVIPTFTHNAIPLSLSDMKEIFNFIKNKYPYADKTLYSKNRSPYDLQSQSLFSAYLLNVKKRKVSSIPWAYYDIGDIKNKNFEIELFVINTSGNRLYSKSEYLYARKLMFKLFNKPTAYELLLDNINELSKDNNEIEIDYFKEQNFTLKIMMEQIKQNKDKIEEQNAFYEDLAKRYNNLLHNLFLILILLLFSTIAYITKLFYRLKSMSENGISKIINFCYFSSQDSEKKNNIIKDEKIKLKDLNL